MKNNHNYFIILSLSLVALLLFSCGIDDLKEEELFLYRLNPIHQVVSPEAARENEVIRIKLEFEISYQCDDFIGFDMKKGENEHERIISAVSSVSDFGKECLWGEKLTYEDGVLEFRVLRKDYYDLKFFNGKDSLNQAKYIEKRIKILQH